MREKIQKENSEVKRQYQKARLLLIITYVICFLYIRDLLPAIITIIIVTSLVNEAMKLAIKKGKLLYDIHKRIENILAANGSLDTESEAELLELKLLEKEWKQQ